jgi:hypothetical protein
VLAVISVIRNTPIEMSCLIRIKKRYKSNLFVGALIILLTQKSVRVGVDERRQILARCNVKPSFTC